MRRVLGAVFLALCTLAPLNIRDATASGAVGMCAAYAKANHCHAKFDAHKNMRVPVTSFEILLLQASKRLVS